MNKMAIIGKVERPTVVRGRSAGLPVPSQVGDVEACRQALGTNMVLGRVPLIVIGSGVSAGAGVPTMRDIHGYLRKKLRSCADSNTKHTADELLGVLERQEQSPRSVQVRLYHLLQTVEEAQIRDLWKQFGTDLLDGKIAPDKPKKLSKIEPSAIHHWAAELAIARRALLVSLNYDGLSARAVNDIVTRSTRSFRAARILSSASDISQYFAGQQRRRRTRLDPIDRSVPIIKFRGDVFHAVCDNARCPESARPAPLYDLIRPQAANRSLACPSCGSTRDLQLSFPGVFGKEREIDHALVALHRMVGSSFAGIICLGFSGAWDERLVEYLSVRAASLDMPILSLSRSHTPAIQIAAGSVGVPFAWQSCISTEELADSLKSLVPPAPIGSICVHVPSFEFAPIAFPLDKAKLEFRFGNQTTEIQPTPDADTLTGVGGQALHLKVISRLNRCSQLGPKAAFLKEPDFGEHTRLHHSATATMLGMLWHDRLLEFRQPEARGWQWSHDARLALEMAILFHDARHLPFSHMMEDVFTELNWGVVPSRAWNVAQYKHRIEPDWEHEPTFTKVFDDALAENRVSGSRNAWWASRVSAIHDGRSGVPWIDGIVDSALDVDKIEYIFRDTRLSGENVRLRDWKSWFETFVGDQSLTSDGLIRLEGQSCFAALELLQERMHLYRKLYLSPELRALESLARYVVTTWLEWRVPQELRIAKWTIYRPDEDLRASKAEVAGNLLWKLYEKREAGTTEIAGIRQMIDELKAFAALDRAAEEWLEQLWLHLAPFARTDGEHPTFGPAQDCYSKLAPIGPLYIHNCHNIEVRRIIRSWRVHYPLATVVDLARFPKFLSTPNTRTVDGFGDNPAVAEQFLVPSVKPSEWRRNRAATVPLHNCDFSGFELPVIQMLILDPLGDASGGSSFVHQMLLRELRNKSISVFESPEEAARHR